VRTLRPILLAAAVAAVPALSRAELKLRWSMPVNSSTIKYSGRGICIDRSGDLFLVGNEKYSETGVDRYHARISYVSRYYQTEFWSQTVNGTGASIYADSFNAVASDLWGDGAVAGGSLWSATTTAPQAVLTYFPWWGGGWSYWSVDVPAASINAVAISSTSFIFVAGESRKVNSCFPGSVDTDIWVGKYDFYGTKLAEDTFTDALCIDDAAMSVAVSPAGNVYVVGYRTVVGNGRDIWLGKYDSDLSLQWWMTLDGPAGSTDYAASVAVAPTGEIVLAGAVSVSASPADDNLDVWVAKVRDNGASGSLLWTWTLDGGDRDADSAYGCVTDAAGNIFVTGFIDIPAPTWEDILLVKLSPSGQVLEQVVKDTGAMLTDIGMGVVIDSNGFPVVGGTATPDLRKFEGMWVGQFYEWIPENILPPMPPGISAYPNPFRPGSGGAHDATGVWFQGVPAGGSLRIYTLAGVLVAEMADSDGDGRIFWDAKNGKGKDVASGLYLYINKDASKGVSKGKVVIIR